MNKRSLGIAAIFLVGCAVGGVSSQVVVPKASAQAAPLTRWQYRCMTEASWNTLRDGFDGAGAQGWELVSYTYSGGFTNPTPTTACFKRPKV